MLGYISTMERLMPRTTEDLSAVTEEISSAALKLRNISIY